MNSALKTVALRWPAPVAARSLGLIQCCPKAAFSTSIPTTPSPRSVSLVHVSLRSKQHQQQSCQVFSVQCTFKRAKSDLASSAQKAPNATDNKTATALGEKPQIKPTPTSANVGATTKGGPTLDWNTFFKQRVRRRRIQVFFSLTTGLVGGFAGAIMLSTGVAEPLVALVPLDPFLTLGLMVIAFTALGWLVGPSIGSEIFYLSNRRIKTQMRLKESEFLARVKKNRADPSNSSAGNPVPDFYGEKIQSVSGYRRWLKDQRAFNRKKTQAFV